MSDPDRGPAFEEPRFELGDESVLLPPRFCRDCGKPLDIDAQDRHVCSQETIRSMRAPSEERSGSLKPAFTLYFLLLVTFIPFFVSESVNVVLTVELVDTLIVFAFVIAMWPRIGPLLRLPDNPTWFLIGIALVAVTYPLAAFMATALESLTGMEALSYTPDYFDAGYGWVVIILSVCVQPAIVEELAFRGVILTGLGDVLNAKEAVVVSSLLFAVLHLAVLSFPHLFVMGVLLALLRIRTGSLWPGMLLHFGHNLVCVLTE